MSKTFKSQSDTTFKVGDRVKVVGDYLNGAYGTVVNTFEGVSVHIDDHRYDGPYDYGCYELELLEEKDKPMEYKTWGEMTREEKGELLLAHHEFKQVQHSHNGKDWVDSKPSWFGGLCYRVKPEEPVVTLDEVYYHPVHGFSNWSGYPYKLTVTRVDGVVDYNSVKMEAL